MENKKSWKTTWSGVIGAVGIICLAISAQFDNNDATTAEWGRVIDAFGMICTIFGIGSLGINARDNDKSSESVGIK